MPGGDEYAKQATNAREDGNARENSNARKKWIAQASRNIHERAGERFTVTSPSTTACQLMDLANAMPKKRKGNPSVSAFIRTVRSRADEHSKDADELRLTTAESTKVASTPEAGRSAMTAAPHERSAANGRFDGGSLATAIDVDSL